MRKYFLLVLALLVGVVGIFLWMHEQTDARLRAEDPLPNKVGAERIHEDASPPHSDTDESSGVETPEPEISPPAVGDVRLFAGGTLKGQFTVYPSDPYKMYEANIDAAKNGNPRAQYKVARALHECTGIPNPVALTQGLQTGSISPQMATDLDWEIQSCAPLLEQVPTEELSARYRDWMAAASESGDALAQSWQLIFGGGLSTASESKEILLRALKENDPAVFTAVASYVSNQFPDSIAQEEAWMLLGCRQQEACNDSAYERFLHGEYQEYQVQEILRFAGEIRTALDENAWDSLGL